MLKAVNYSTTEYIKYTPQLHLLVVIICLHLLARAGPCDETLGEFRDGTALSAGINFWGLTKKDCLCRCYRFYKALSPSRNSATLNPGGNFLFGGIEADYLESFFKYNLMSTVPSARWNWGCPGT